MRYGMWTVVEAEGRKWLCRCDCGVERRVIRSDLWAGKSTGCGCAREAKLRPAQLLAVVTHGYNGTPTYQTWVDMRRRCNNPDRPDYVNYGARGITVCEEWNASFEAFLADMGTRPDGHTIERMDNNGPYAKWNCKWVPRAEQERNKRTSRWVDYGGVRMTVAEACERSGITQNAALARLNRGMNDNDTFTKPMRVTSRRPT